MIRTLFRPLYVLAAVVVISIACLAGGIAYHQTRYEGRAFPGVRLQGIDLSGLSPEEIFNVAQLQGRYFTTPSIVLRANGQTFTYRPADFGVGLDPAETARAAMSIGREGDLSTQLRKRIEAWWRGVDVSPVVRLDDAEAAHVIGQVAKATERAPHDAKISFEGGAVKETQSQTGITLDRNAALRLVNSAILANQPSSIDLPYKTLSPQVSTASDAIGRSVRRGRRRRRPRSVPQEGAPPSGRPPEQRETATGGRAAFAAPPPAPDSFGLEPDDVSGVRKSTADRDRDEERPGAGSPFASSR